MTDNTHRRLRTPFLFLGGLLAATALFGMSADRNPVEGPAEEAMQKMRDYVGTFDFKATLDLTPLGQPGVQITFPGTASSQFVLGGSGILGVSEADNKQSVSYIGYRTDTNEYYNLNMDANQTGLSYMSGNYAKPDLLKMRDPTTGVNMEVVYGKDGASTATVRIPPTQAVLLKSETTQTSRNAGDVLGRLLSGPVKPTRVNRKADNPNPAENYARFHDLLHKLAGKFVSEDGYKAVSRMVGEGRYVLTHVTGGRGEFLTFTAYNNAGGFFQQMMVGPSLPTPIYLQGGMKPDGSIELADPFNPNGISVLLSFDSGGGYSATASMGGQVVEERAWRLEK